MQECEMKEQHSAGFAAQIAVLELFCICDLGNLPRFWKLRFLGTLTTTLTNYVCGNSGTHAAGRGAAYANDMATAMQLL